LTCCEEKRRGSFKNDGIQHLRVFWSAVFDPIPRDLQKRRKRKRKKNKIVGAGKIDWDRECACSHRVRPLHQHEALRVLRVVRDLREQNVPLFLCPLTLLDL